jgi:hypothetical protein
MGITHFAPVGTRPGAVTSALSYLKHNQDKFFIKGELIEKVILFASPEVREGDIVRECKNNDYGSYNGPEWKNKTVLEVIKKN